MSTDAINKKLLAAFTLAKRIQASSSPAASAATDESWDLLVEIADGTKQLAGKLNEEMLKNVAPHKKAEVAEYLKRATDSVAASDQELAKCIVAAMSK